MSESDVVATEVEQSDELKAILKSPTSKFRLEFLDLTRRVGKSFCATISQLAALFDVGGSTIDKWIADIPEFAEAVHAARALADGRVERALYERATGYEYECEKIFCDAKTGLVTKTKWTEHVPPDNLAMIFWLKNRQPGSWHDVHRSEISGPSGAPLPVINITLNTTDGALHIQPPRNVTPELPSAKELPAPGAQYSKSGRRKHRKGEPK